MMNLQQFSLKGKVAVITGGSRESGRAAALAMADAGAHVVVLCLRTRRSQAAAEEISARGVKGSVHALAAHVRKMDDSRALVDQVEGIVDASR